MQCTLLRRLQSFMQCTLLRRLQSFMQCTLLWRQQSLMQCTLLWRLQSFKQCTLPRTFYRISFLIYWYPINIFIKSIIIVYLFFVKINNKFVCLKSFFMYVCSLCHHRTLYGARPLCPTIHCRDPAGGYRLYIGAQRQVYMFFYI